MNLKPFFILVILLLTGCTLSPINFSEQNSLAQDEGIVFGCVKVIEGGKEKKLSTLGESNLRLIVLPDNSSKAIYVPLKDDGTFIWHLPAGSYTIASFEWLSYGSFGGRIFANFRTYKNNINYIGTLAIMITGGRYMMLVTDEYEVSYTKFKNKFPDMKQEVSRHLMEMEERR